MTKQVKKIVLAGSPNVGKSVIFNSLTGTYATVSNYPGTTVDILRGVLELNGEKYEMIDTPGIYSLFPLSGEEMVSRRLLETENPDLILHVTDAKNIRRLLNLTLELKESGVPLILVL
ncbi:MAG: 50S ribosome-binding GTPase, partial [Sporomusaceae bacterium]|nr:50S ribosome-binding GTPase [Sporomusaceae bacterium]